MIALRQHRAVPPRMPLQSCQHAADLVPEQWQARVVGGKHKMHLHARIHRILEDTSQVATHRHTIPKPRLGHDVLAVERKLLKFVPEEFKQHAHHWLILHGRYVCKARAPACPSCAIRDLCEYRHKTKAPEVRSIHP